VGCLSKIPQGVTEGIIKNGEILESSTVKIGKKTKPVGGTLLSSLRQSGEDGVDNPRKGEGKKEES